jgi:hypothetical protein
MKWRFYFSQQPSVFYESPIFTVTVVDPCDPPVGFTAPTVIPSTLFDQEYTISGSTKTYQIPQFTTTPPQCQSRLQYSFNVLTNAPGPVPVGTGTGL